jgi:hypothetical protein
MAYNCGRAAARPMTMAAEEKTGRSDIAVFRWGVRTP